MTTHFLCEKECTGCGACVNVCSLGAIEMRPNKEGFLYPEIEATKCIGCGACEKVCPLCKVEEQKGRETVCYAAWSRDEEVRNRSASGGVFSHFATAILQMSGVVVGARYREDNLVEHVLIRSEEDLDCLRQSKYVQSEIGTIFRQIKVELDAGKIVLFVGTPCQCAGVRAYLDRDYDNLYLCDFVCYGVNSPLAYTTYLHEMEKRYGSEIKKVWFKSKEREWNKCATKLVFENGEEYLADKWEDMFMKGFIRGGRGLFLRMSCYDCKFKGEKRPVDITLGDFWGIEKYLANVDAKKGVSLLLLHSEKGKKLFEQINDQLEFYPMKIEEAVAGNPKMVISTEYSREREEFFASMSKYGFEKSVRMYLNEGR